MKAFPSSEMKTSSDFVHFKHPIDITSFAFFIFYLFDKTFSFALKAERTNRKSKTISTEEDFPSSGTEICIEKHINYVCTCPCVHILLPLRSKILNSKTAQDNVGQICISTNGQRRVIRVQWSKETPHVLQDLHYLPQQLWVKVTVCLLCKDIVIRTGSSTTSWTVRWRQIV